MTANHASHEAEVIGERLRSSAACKLVLAEDATILETIGQVARTIVTSLEQGGTIFFCGNGGSSTDADHLSAELLGRFYRDRPALRSVSLSTNTSAMTAIGNDYGYDQTFVRQLSGLARPGDVLVGLSTSGNSANVLEAIMWANKNQVATVAFTGGHGGEAAKHAEVAFRVPSDDTPRIQECHLNVGHSICELVEDALFPRS